MIMRGVIKIFSFFFYLTTVEFYQSLTQHAIDVSAWFSRNKVKFHAFRLIGSRNLTMFKEDIYASFLFCHRFSISYILGF